MNRRGLFIAALILLFIIGVVSFSTKSSTDPCEVAWKRDKAMYLTAHNPLYSTQDEYDQAHHAFINDCKDGVPQ